MLCDSVQIGSGWAQRMMMVPATNISASTIPSTTTTAPAAAAAAAAGGGSSTSCSSSSAKLKGVMLHQHQQQDLQQHGAAALKCPRCDSSNTKFCYYNNYSLSQPRHFCKACKRYWTRGGTLRNVPVGGGCRKNKRAKKSSQHPQQQQSAAAATPATVPAAAAADPPRSSSLPTRNLPASATNDLISSFLYPDMNLAAFSGTGTGTAAPYDALGLGGLINNNLADLQQQAAASFLNNDYCSPSFGSQAASSLVSTTKQPKKAEHYDQSLLPYDAGATLGFPKEVKVEGDNSLMGDNTVSTEWQASYPFEAINGASDAAYLYWNSVMGGAGGWPDAANPSIAPLI